MSQREAMSCTRPRGVRRGRRVHTPRTKPPPVRSRDGCGVSTRRAGPTAEPSATPTRRDARHRSTGGCADPRDASPLPQFVRGDCECRTRLALLLLVATAPVLELPPIGGSLARTSCLCSGCDRSGRVALLLVVQSGRHWRLHADAPFAAFRALWIPADRARDEPLAVEGRGGVARVVRELG